MKKIPIPISLLCRISSPVLKITLLAAPNSCSKQGIGKAYLSEFKIHSIIRVPINLGNNTFSKNENNSYIVPSVASRFLTFNFDFLISAFLKKNNNNIRLF